MEGVSWLMRRERMVSCDCVLGMVLSVEAALREVVGDVLAVGARAPAGPMAWKA